MYFLKLLVQIIQILKQIHLDLVFGMDFKVIIYFYELAIEFTNTLFPQTVLRPKLQSRLC